MCGICGMVNRRSSAPIDAEALKQMVWALRHRGPDEQGIYVDECAGLGHARLSIVDLAGGAQPMANEDQSLWIVFNGEIYNHIELRPGLESRGHTFTTRCDTEVILHLYEEHGPACLEHLNGQFAFAIWDRSNRTVFLARDRFGIRPLYYTLHDGRLFFASEVKSFAAAGVPLAVDPIGLDQTFTFWSPVAPRTIFEKIQQVPPGHFVHATSSDLSVKRYWAPEFPPEDSCEERSDEDYIEGLREVLVEATRLRMRADVPVAAYLSGGLDSSLTTAIIRNYTDAPLSTFSVRFQDTAFDEGPYQQAMADLLGTDHHSTMVSKEDIAGAFDGVLWHTETPILRTAPVPLFHLSRLVRDSGTKVVVTGEGADEVFAGYNIFKEAKIRRFWARRPDSPWRPLLLGRVYPYIQRQGHPGGGAYWQRFFEKGLTETDLPTYSHRIRWDNATPLKRLFSKDIRARIGGYDGVTEYETSLPEGFGSWAALSQAQHIEMNTFMAGYLLSSQGDRMAMAHSVEGRFPFLDHHVAEFAARIPPRLKLRVLEEKHILRRVAQDLVPASVLERPKQPYRAPDSASFFTQEAPDFVRDVLSESAISRAGYFDAQGVTRLVRKCCKMSKEGVSARDDMALVGILSTQLLHTQFVEAGRGGAIAPSGAFRLHGPSRET